jgi:hypothetical protein
MLKAPWMAISPGIALSLAVFGFNMLGDAQRDLLDPMLRQIGKQIKRFWLNGQPLAKAAKLIALRVELILTKGVDHHTASLGPRLSLLARVCMSCKECYHGVNY